MLEQKENIIGKVPIDLAHGASGDTSWGNGAGPALKSVRREVWKTPNGLWAGVAGD
jgi:hypothetical protein